MPFNDSFLCFLNSYESSIGKDPEKEKVKPHFSQTIMFVEDYLNLVSQDGSFSDREQNKLTYEVRMTLGLSDM